MKVFYRISNASYNKLKLPGASKLNCLRNFLYCFEKSEIYIVADNMYDIPYSDVEKLCDGKVKDIFRTNNSNAGSLIWSLKKAIEISQEGEKLYFCEDDYFHFKGETPFGFKSAEDALIDGLSLSDYITLYDHPDKYQNDYNMGEMSWVCKTNLSHWRSTISTCMTFGTNSSVLSEDLSVWEKWTQSSHPHDHQIFNELNKDKGRNLLVSIPGLACHLDLTYPLKKGNENLIEPWAMNIAEVFLRKTLGDIDVFAYTGLKKLMLLESISENIKK
jgi:hypothetical protein